MENWKANMADFDMETLKSITVSRDFRLAHPVLVERLKEAIEAYERNFVGRKVLVTCTFRSPTEQQRLYKQGRNGNPGPIVTKCDGITHKSQHNYFPSRAVDVAIIDGGKTLYDETSLYPLGVLAKQCKLEWGGFWDKCDTCHKVLEQHAGADHAFHCFRDYPHFQVPHDETLEEVA